MNLKEIKGLTLETRKRSKKDELEDEMEEGPSLKHGKLT